MYQVRSSRLSGTTLQKNAVVPAQAGTQSIQALENTTGWIPAFAGMTNFGKTTL
jgi:hypothetical protein